MLVAGCMVYVFLSKNFSNPSHYTPSFLFVAGVMAVSSHPKIVPILPVMHQFALVAGYMAMYYRSFPLDHQFLFVTGFMAMFSHSMLYRVRFTLVTGYRVIYSDHILYYTRCSWCCTLCSFVFPSVTVSKYIWFSVCQLSTILNNGCNAVNLTLKITTS